jgi:hypothetical protein
MHKQERSFCYFGNEQLRLREHLESLGKEKIVWESLRTVETISPVFKGKAPALSIELLFNSDKTLKEARIHDRVKSITAKYDGSGKLVMDDWLLKHPECMEAAKDYEQKLNVLLIYTHSIQKPSLPEPQKHVQEPIIAGSPKQVFQPHIIKTETAIPAPQQEVKKAAFRYLPGVMGRRPFTPEQIEIRNKEIDAFCKEKGIDIKHHTVLYKSSFENLKRIVALCEEKQIPFTPYRNFLSFIFTTFNRDIKIIEKYNLENPEFSKFDLAEHHSVFAFAPETLSENLKICVEKKRDPVKEGFVSMLNLKHQDFIGYLESKKPELAEEEKRKKVIEIMTSHGIDEKDIKEYVKKKAPETVERILEICDKHNFDWKAHQVVFSYTPDTTNSNLDACESHNIDPVKFELLSDLVLPNKKFNARLEEIIEKGVQPKVLSEEEKRSRVLEILAREGLSENEVDDYTKKKAPETVEGIIGICNRHNLDWKNNQILFRFPPNVLESNLSLCDFNNVDPVKFGITSRLTLPRDDFKEYLKVLMAQKGLEFKEPEIQKDI